jgi:hypothetical protein
MEMAIDVRLEWELEPFVCACGVVGHRGDGASVGSALGARRASVISHPSSIKWRRVLSFDWVVSDSMKDSVLVVRAGEGERVEWEFTCGAGSASGQCRLSCCVVPFVRRRCVCTMPSRVRDGVVCACDEYRDMLQFGSSSVPAAVV